MRVVYEGKEHVAWPKDACSGWKHPARRSANRSKEGARARCAMDRACGGEEACVETSRVDRCMGSSVAVGTPPSHLAGRPTWETDSRSWVRSSRSISIRFFSFPSKRVRPIRRSFVRCVRSHLHRSTGRCQARRGGMDGESNHVEGEGLPGVDRDRQRGRGIERGIERDREGIERGSRGDRVGLREGLREGSRGDREGIERDREGVERGLRGIEGDLRGGLRRQRCICGWGASGGGTSEGDRGGRVWMDPRHRRGV